MPANPSREQSLAGFDLRQRRRASLMVFNIFGGHELSG
jgi:hypothetical protein